MGVCLTPEFEPAVPEAKYDGDGKGLAKNMEALAEIAAAKGVTPFTHFLGYVEDESGQFDNDDEATEDSPPAVIADEWFSADDGVAMVGALIAAIESDSRLRKKVDDPKYTLEELRELERGLRIAQAKGSRFRLAMW